MLRHNYEAISGTLMLRHPTNRERSMFDASTAVGWAPNGAAGAGPSVARRHLAGTYGLFVHLVPHLTVDSTGRPVSLLDLGRRFDVEAFVADLVDFGVDFVRVTAWHQGMYPLYPSTVMDRWRGEGTSSPRDIIGDLITALEGTGIALQLYTHPRDGHDFPTREQVSTGWGDGALKEAPDPDASTFDFPTWNDFVVEAYEELLQRYGSRVQSIYLDEGSERADSEWVVDYPRLTRTIRRLAPNAVIQQNYYGNLYGADVADHEYCRWGEFADPAVGTRWPAYRSRSVSTVVGSLWWASNASPEFEPGFSPEDLYRYLVLQVAVNESSGGLSLAAGPLADGGWEGGVRNLLVEVGRLLGPVAASIVGARPSTLWPTADLSTVDSVGWGVATEDDEYTYLHVFRARDGRLRVPLPQGGVAPRSVTRLNANSDVTVHVVDGEMVLEEQDPAPHGVDTVFRVRF